MRIATASVCGSLGGVHGSIAVHVDSGTMCSPNALQWPLLKRMIPVVGHLTHCTGLGRHSKALCYHLLRLAGQVPIQI